MRQHGTYACYVFGQAPGGDTSKGCRCEECRAACREQRKKDAARIEPAYVSADPVREHIAFLATHEVGLKQIAKVSGVAHGALWKIVHGVPSAGSGPSKRCRPQTAEAILAVTPADGGDGSRVPAGPTMANIERLVAAGVPKVRIAERLGNRGPLQVGKGDSVNRKTARAIADMVAELDAGTLVTVKRHRHGDREIAPEASTEREDELRARARRHQSRDRQRQQRMGVEFEPSPLDDIDEFYLELALIIERRAEEPWRAEAACRNRPSWMWFPADGDEPAIAAAKKVCGACLVRQECLAANLDTKGGIYGGLTEGEREQLLVEAAAS